MTQQSLSTRSRSLRDHTEAFLIRKHRLLIDGAWEDSTAGGRFEVVNPATGLLIATVASAEAVDADRAVAAARKALEQGSWSRLSPAHRSRLIWRLADVLEERSEDVAELEVLDSGKPVANARQDVANAVEMFRYMAGWATKLTGETVPASTPGIVAYTQREPVGVVAQIIPWNFPLGMASWKLAPALAAGCTIVLKPAEQTPLSALLLGELICEAGFPPGVVNILTGFGHTVGAALAAHSDVDKVAFTGSTEVGKTIIKAAAGNLKRVTLELGGKSPAIVFPDADLATAIPGVANAIFYNQGQNCAAGSRLYVHRKVFDNVIDKLSQQAQALVVGNGFDPEVDLGPLISSKQLQRVAGYVEKGREEGATIHAGGEPADIANGYFYKPTVLVNTHRAMTVVREEIFGPVVCVQRFDDESIEQIVHLANDTEYGLAASVWTKDLSVAHRMTRAIKAGTVWVNMHSYIEPGMPFGGYKQSGWGREMGRQAVEAYTETKSTMLRIM